MECKVLYELLALLINQSINLRRDLKMFSKGKMLPFPIEKFTLFWCHATSERFWFSTVAMSYGRTFMTVGTQRGCLFACLYQMKKCLTTITISSGVADIPSFQHSFSKGLLTSVLIRTLPFQFNTRHILLPSVKTYLLFFKGFPESFALNNSKFCTRRGGGDGADFRLWQCVLELR